MNCAGLLLAAGADHRMGVHKALVRHGTGTSWVHRSAWLLAVGGCDPVLVVLGAAADQARRQLPPGVEVVVVPDWAEGMGTSLRAGLAALPASAPAAGAALVLLVDLPDLVPAVVRRVVNLAAPSALARATYGDGADARRGHPVLLGRDHPAGQRCAPGPTTSSTTTGCSPPGSRCRHRLGPPRPSARHGCSRPTSPGETSAMTPTPMTG